MTDMYFNYMGSTIQWWRWGILWIFKIHSIDDNKNYNIALPENDLEMKQKFENLICTMRTFDMNGFVQDNAQKCSNCIYEDACDRSASRGD